MHVLASPTGIRIDRRRFDVYSASLICCIYGGSRAPPKRERGRPPVYFLDHDGKPIVGVSLLETDGWYHATGYKPPHYLARHQLRGSSSRVPRRASQATERV